MKAFGPDRRSIAMKFGEGAGRLCALALALRSGWLGEVPSDVQRRTGLDNDALQQVAAALFRAVDVLDDEPSAEDARRLIIDALEIELPTRGRKRPSMPDGEAFARAYEYFELTVDQGMSPVEAKRVLGDRDMVSDETIRRNFVRYSTEVRSRRRVNHTRRRMCSAPDCQAKGFLIAELFAFLRARIEAPFDVSIMRDDGTEVHFGLRCDEEMFAAVSAHRHIPEWRPDAGWMLKQLFSACCADLVDAAGGWTVMEEEEMANAAARLIKEQTGRTLYHLEIPE